MIRYDDIKWPEKKIWSDDRAMTIYKGSDNYKIGFNDAMKLCQSAVRQAERKWSVEEIEKIICETPSHLVCSVADIKKIAQAICKMVNGEK